MHVSWSSLALAAAVSFATDANGAAKAAAGSGKGIPEHYSKIAYPEFTYQPPHPKDYRMVLDRGVVAYLVPDTTLALIQMTVLFGHPNLPAKPSDVGPMNLYSSMLKAGGTIRFKPEQLEDSLEFVAASLGAGIGDFQAEESLDALQKDAYALYDLLPEVALQPRLDAEVFKVQKRAYLENIRHRYDTPNGVMGVAYEHVMYGGHPGNWMATEKEVGPLGTGSLKPWIGTGYAVKNMVIGVAGKFDRAEMIAHLNKFIAKFPDGYKNGVDSIPPYRGPDSPGIYIVDKQATQATIKLGAPGVRRPHPDYYPLVVASYIFGDGGFTSRLMEKVRSNEGLAYGIDSDVGSDYYRRATVSVSLQTKVETGAYAVKLVLAEMRRMAKEGVTDVELQRAKDGLIKSLPALFDTPQATAHIFAQGEIWKRSPEHYVEYMETIGKMTKAEVEAAFRKYFDPDSMRIVVVGPKEQLMKPDERNQAALSQFGPVRDLTLQDIEARKEHGK
ncbi:MAG TPA: pitrilysin family protein [Fibrobacteria bacterium]|nr:pitrilysin family protein [Fibrobacteria bacterium]